MMTDEEMIVHVKAIQQAAVEGKQPHEMLIWLLTHIQPTWVGQIPRISVERCLMKAFGIPLREARNVESWCGFDKSSKLTDEDIDKLLSPWVLDYIHSFNNE